MVQKRTVSFLKNNCEIQVILETIPHKKIFIFNNNGKMEISEKSQIKKIKKDTKKEDNR